MFGLPNGIQSMIDGKYTPRHLKRYYFADEMVDQLHIVRHEVASVSCLLEETTCVTG